MEDPRADYSTDALPSLKTTAKPAPVFIAPDRGKSLQSLHKARFEANQG